MNWTWDHLNHLQVGRYGEYLTKMELVRHGLDVYTSEVDDRGIDFVVRLARGRYIDVQVKSVRKGNYVFFQKSKFEPGDDLYAALVLLTEGKPADLYLIPSTRWLEPDSVFVDRDYEGKASKPEFGINPSVKNLPSLEPYRFEATLLSLLGPST